MQNIKIDPVTVEVIRNLLLSITDETNTIIIKSAYSTNIKERRDNSAAIMDPAGNVVVQVEGSIPILLAAQLFTARNVLKKYKPEDIHPGDMFIANDPYNGGGNHLSDITVVAPAFFENKLVGWVGNIAHHGDIGGKVPGSIAGDALSIFEEGIRIPIVKICKAGKINEDVMDMLLANTRVKEERRGILSLDFCKPDWCSKASGGISKVWSNASRLHGRDTSVCGAFNANAIKIPEGIYTFADYVDGCGDLVPHPINICKDYS